MDWMIENVGTDLFSSEDNFWQMRQKTWRRFDGFDLPIRRR
jgi:hypothetical protein